MARAFVAALAAAAAAAESIEMMLPMRDGVKLHTFINFPLFWTNGSKPLAVLLLTVKMIWREWLCTWARPQI